MTTRDEFFHRSGVELYDDVRANLVVFERDASGALNIKEPVAYFQQIMLQSSQESDSEKTQVVLGSDAPKLYAFGRQHRFFVYQAFILDTNLDREIEIRTDYVNLENNTTGIWTGKSYSELQSFYRKYASLHACAKNRYLVRLSYNGKQMYGAINQLTVSTDATQPNKYDVSFSFYCTAVDSPGVPDRRFIPLEPRSEESENN